LCSNFLFDIFSKFLFSKQKFSKRNKIEKETGIEMPKLKVGKAKKRKEKDISADLSNNSKSLQVKIVEELPRKKKRTNLQTKREGLPKLEAIAELDAILFPEELSRREKIRRAFEAVGEEVGKVLDELQIEVEGSSIFTRVSSLDLR
jgi:hypothetical protein